MQSRISPQKSTNRRTRLIVGSGLIVLLAASALIAWLFQLALVDADKTVVLPFDKIYAEGIDFTSFDTNGRPIFTLRAAEIVHARDKIRFLRINPVKVVKMKDVSLEIHPRMSRSRTREEIHQGMSSDRSRGGAVRDSARASVPFGDFLKETLSAVGSGDLGFVARIVVDKIEVKSRRSPGNTFTINSKRAQLDLGKSAVVFENGFLLLSQGDELLAKDAEWQPEENRFLIRGSYALRDGKKVESGAGAYFYINSSGINKVSKVTK